MVLVLKVFILHFFFPTVSQASLFKNKVMTDIVFKIKNINEYYLPSDYFPQNSLPPFFIFPINWMFPIYWMKNLTPKALAQISGSCFPSFSCFPHPPLLPPPLREKQAPQLECMRKPRMVSWTKGNTSPSKVKGTKEYRIVKWEPHSLGYWNGSWCQRKAHWWPHERRLSSLKILSWE